jgi:peptidoglycan/LPS O-acetylase OafA/YrhL/AcrR family transcriptional regulator
VLQTSPGQTALEGVALPRRLAWLDALRGFAALCVVFDHSSSIFFEPLRTVLYRVVDFGQYGVFVFFLVSGYIVPASLERKGSVRAFWTSRAFRLYPMFLAALILAWIAQDAGRGNIADAGKHPLASVASWLLMLQNLLTGPNVPNVAWTLSYEMTFYLVLVALFSWGIHRWSGGYAVGCSIAAVALGGVLPMAALSVWAARYRHGAAALDLAADVLILAGIALAVAGRRKTGASLAAATVLVLVCLNQGYPYPWSGFTILALMFTGTLIYRADRGEVRKLTAAGLTAAVLILTIAAGEWHAGHRDTAWKFQWASSILLAAATFGIAMAVRRFRIPRAAAWLGLISYSIYLVHPLILNAYRTIPALHRAHPIGTEIGLAAGVYAVIIAVSAATYYGIEKPMQRLGRRLARRYPLYPNIRARREYLRSTQDKCYPHRMDNGARCPAHQGLRERKKAETREAISRAAVELALRDGLENVRVADVAATADVSPRTYNNYFASIAEAVCADMADRALALADAVRGRPEDEPLDEAIASAIISTQSAGEPDRALIKMIIHTPALRGEFFKAIVARDAALAEVIAERTGTQPGDLYPEILAAAVSSVTRVVSQRWLQDDTADYATLLREALTMVAPMTKLTDRKTSGHEAA